MIRKMKLEDIDAVVALENKIFGHTLGDNMFKHEINENEAAFYYVLETNGQIIGYLSSWVYGTSAEIVNFLIDVPYQRQKYGKRLFDYLLNEYKKMDIKTISLEVRVSNELAIAFYIKYDFKCVHIRKNYYIDEDALLLIKEM